MNTGYSSRCQAVLWIMLWRGVYATTHFFKLVNFQLHCCELCNTCCRSSAWGFLETTTIQPELLLLSLLWYNAWSFHLEFLSFYFPRLYWCWIVVLIIYAQDGTCRYCIQCTTNRKKKFLFLICFCWSFLIFAWS